MTDLLPCPFCGSDAIHIYPASGAGQYVTCAKCFAATGQNLEDPVTAWNTRHPSRNDVLEEAAKACAPIAEEAGEKAARGFETDVERARRLGARDCIAAIRALKDRDR